MGRLVRAEERRERVTPRAASPAASAVRVVDAGPQHLPAIVELEGRCFPPVDRFAPSSWRHLLGAAHARGSSMTFVALADGRVVGALNALLRRGGHTARLYSLAVDPAQRGRGIGALLVRHLARRLPARITALSLEVRRGNVAARALYERLGFTLHEELPGWYPDGGDGVRLRVTRTALVS
jgi:[ribosomal protein S18]-alanine N-acetyltransferase